MSSQGRVEGYKIYLFSKCFIKFVVKKLIKMHVFVNTHALHYACFLKFNKALVIKVI